MTDPITVDVPTKSRPVLASLPPLPPLPKLADKAPEPAKAAPTPNPVATMPSAPATTPDATATKPAAKQGSFKKKLTVAASALLSLGGGVAAVHFFSPGNPTPPVSPPVASVSRDATPSEQKPIVHQEQPKPAPENIPATQLPVVPVAAVPASPVHPTRPGALPEPAMPAPLLPAIPSAGPASPLGSPPAPTWEQDKRAGGQTKPTMPAPALEPPAKPPTITLAGGTDPGPLVPATLPMIPAAGPAAPPLPAIPSAGPAAPVGAPPAVPMIPAASGPAAPTLPAIPPAGTPTTPPIDLAPKLPAATPPAIPPVGPASGNPTAAPKTPLPEPGDLLAPPAKGPSTPPAPVTGTPVNGSPVVPVLPPELGPPAVTPTKPTVTPPAPPAPEFNPKPTPEFNPKPVGVGSNTEVTKPVSNKPDPKPTVTPVAAIERSPTTSFDVDIHEPKTGDTYEAISREFYNDTRYAAALRAYNRNKPLQGSGPIDVPPLHVLKRYSQNPQPQSGVVPVSQTNTTPEWGSATPSPTARTGGDKAFRIPTGGMSMRAVARLTMGNEQRWNDIYTLNPQLRPDEVLPAGTDLRLPADARIP